MVSMLGIDFVRFVGHPTPLCALELRKLIAFNCEALIGAARSVVRVVDEQRDARPLLH